MANEKHYIYELVDKTTGEFYWGVRTCKCEIKDDEYMGSMIKWKPIKENLIKRSIIEYNTREQANLVEEKIIKYYIDKVKFPLNRNYCYGKNILSECASRKGAKLSYEHKQNIVNCNKSRVVSEETKLKMSNSAKLRCTDEWKQSLIERNKTRIVSLETRQKMSKSRTGKQYKTK